MSRYTDTGVVLLALATAVNAVMIQLHLDTERTHTPTTDRVTFGDRPLNETQYYQLHDAIENKILANLYKYGYGNYRIRISQEEGQYYAIEEGEGTVINGSIQHWLETNEITTSSNSDCNQ